MQGMKRLLRWLRAKAYGLRFGVKLKPEGGWIEFRYKGVRYRRQAVEGHVAMFFPRDTLAQAVLTDEDQLSVFGRNPRLDANGMISMDQLGQHRPGPLALAELDAIVLVPSRPGPI
jgi:hypothetical protein